MRVSCSFLHVLYLVEVQGFSSNSTVHIHVHKAPLCISLYIFRLHKKNILVTRLFGKDLCPAACSSDLRNSVTRLKSVSKLAGYWRGARRCDLGSENGPRNACEARLASSGGILPAMVKLKNPEILLVEKVDNTRSVKGVNNSLGSRCLYHTTVHVYSYSLPHERSIWRSETKADLGGRLRGP